MGLVTNITKTIKILDEDETATIRKLSHKQLKEASRAKQSEGVSFMKELGAELLSALRENKTDAEMKDSVDKMKKLQDAQEANITTYDRDTLLKYGIAEWSYPVKPIAEVGLNGVDQLDEPAAKFLAQEIFDFSRPETKAETKNV